jgi:FKBP-type peptidyl-prolyl cis-trans isomerase 2
LKLPAGQNIQTIISRIDGEAITLDANHPLAGRTLVFSTELVGIVAS